MKTGVFESFVALEVNYKKIIAALVLMFILNTLSFELI